MMLVNLSCDHISIRVGDHMLVAGDHNVLVRKSRRGGGVVISLDDRISLVITCPWLDDRYEILVDPVLVITVLSVGAQHISVILIRSLGNRYLLVQDQSLYDQV